MCILLTRWDVIASLTVFSLLNDFVTNIFTEALKPRGLNNALVRVSGLYVCLIVDLQTLTFIVASNVA